MCTVAAQYLNKLYVVPKTVQKLNNNNDYIFFCCTITIAIQLQLSVRDSVLGMKTCEKLIKNSDQIHSQKR